MDIEDGCAGEEKIGFRFTEGDGDQALAGEGFLFESVHSEILVRLHGCISPHFLNTFSFLLTRLAVGRSIELNTFSLTGVQN